MMPQKISQFEFFRILLKCVFKVYSPSFCRFETVSLGWPTTTTARGDGATPRPAPPAAEDSETDTEEQHQLRQSVGVARSRSLAAASSISGSLQTRQQPNVQQQQVRAVAITHQSINQSAKCRFIVSPVQCNSGQAAALCAARALQLAARVLCCGHSAPAAAAATAQQLQQWTAAQQL